MANDTATNSSFSSRLTALEGIVDALKTGTLPLEDALKLFEEGVSHLTACQHQLNNSRGKVEELVASLQSGEPSSTRPFEES